LAKIHKEYCDVSTKLQKYSDNPYRNILQDEYDEGPPPMDFNTFLEVIHIIRIYGNNRTKILRSAGIDLWTLTNILKILYKYNIELARYESPLIETPEKAQSIFNNILANIKIPKPDQSFHQSPCVPADTINRVRRIISSVPLSGRKILCLGDDDFVSVALAKFSNADVYTLDIDGRIIDTIDKIKSNENLDINIIQHDLREPLPSNLINKFDCVSCDPPQSLKGEIYFLKNAHLSLKNESSLRTYVSITPHWMGFQDLQKLQQEIIVMGYCEIEHYKCEMDFTAFTKSNNTKSLNSTHSLISQILEGSLLMSCDLYVLKTIAY